MIRRRRNNSDSDDQPNLYNRYQNSGHTFETPVQPTSSTVLDSEMSCRDRTNEFASAVKSLQSRQLNGHIPSSRKAEAIKQRSEFTQIAK